MILPIFFSYNIAIFNSSISLCDLGTNSQRTRIARCFSQTIDSLRQTFYSFLHFPLPFLSMSIRMNDNAFFKLLLSHLSPGRGYGWLQFSNYQISNKLFRSIIKRTHYKVFCHAIPFEIFFIHVIPSISHSFPTHTHLSWVQDFVDNRIIDYHYYFYRCRNSS